MCKLKRHGITHYACVGMPFQGLVKLTWQTIWTDDTK